MKRLAFLIAVFMALPAMAQSFKYVVYPNDLDTGAGSEGSPWVNSDSAAGILTALGTLESSRGGLALLLPGRFDVSAPIEIGNAGSGLTIGGATAGFPTQPNASFEGTWATKIHSNQSSGSIFQIDASSTKLGGVSLRDLEIWGYGTTPSAPAAAVSITGDTDTLTVDNLRIGNAGIGIYATRGDDIIIRNSFVVQTGYPLLFNGSGFWAALMANDGFYDNDYNVSITDTGSNEHLRFIGNSLVRDCRSSSCSAEPAGLFWSANDSIVSSSLFQDAGICLTGVGTCTINNSSTMSQIIVAGSRNTIEGNSIAETTLSSGECGISLSSGANNNKISGNTFYNNGTDICIKSGASDTIVNQPAATISDAGTRTVVNGVGTNAGDPNSTGDWAATAKWAGLVIRDTTDSVTWLYTSLSARQQL